MVLVLVATVVIVVLMDPVDPRLDRCARRSSRRRSHSHQSWNGAPVVGLVVVVVVARSLGCGSFVECPWQACDSQQNRWYSSFQRQQRPTTFEKVS